MGIRRRVLAGVVVPLLLVIPGCSQRGRQDLADEVAHSVDRSKGPVLGGTLTVTLRPVRLPGGRQVPPEMRSGTLAVFGVVLDAKAAQAALLGPGNEPVVLYDPTTIYARRVVKSKADKRLWSRLELDRLPDTSLPSFNDITQGAQPGDAVVIGPLFLTDLLSGVLTGSVRQREVDRDGNRLITFNASISKANRELDVRDDDRKAREKLLRTLAIKDDIGPGKVVLAKDGTLSRVTFVFAERPDKQTRLDLEAVLTVAPLETLVGKEFAPAPGTKVRPPPRETTVRVPAFGTLRATVTAQLAQLGVQAPTAAGMLPAPPPPTSSPTSTPGGSG